MKGADTEELALPRLYATAMRLMALTFVLLLTVCGSAVAEPSLDPAHQLLGRVQTQHPTGTGTAAHDDLNRPRQVTPAAADLESIWG